jgi:membrane-bound lytic murein transglycosylase A
LGRAALSKARARAAAALRGCAAALLAVVLASSADAKPRHHETYRPKPVLDFPFQIEGAQYGPLPWSEIAGWSEDDHLAAVGAFRISCQRIVQQRRPYVEAVTAGASKALVGSLREPCLALKAADVSTAQKARDFFEQHFLPLRISRLGEDAGFVTGYFEPIIDGSRTRADVYTVPVYRRPSNLFVRGVSQSATSLPNKGQVFRKIGRRKLVPYYDRAEIEDGAIAGRGLEIAWLKSETDLLFTQIQGSARIRLEDGGMLRINYEAHNGYSYTPVGRILIERNIVPKDQMSMQRIRAWMDENPDGAKELRRANRSYVFFRLVNLSETDEAVGAQGVPLTAGRSIAVDRFLHVYGTPFFIEGELPIETEVSKTPFRRLMVAQDTGSAIIGPARADLYFGAGAEAGRVSGRLRHPARFVMLVPKSLDPAARGRTMPLPADRPSARIAKLFPQTLPKDAPKAVDAGAAKDTPKPAANELVKEAAKPAEPAAATEAAKPPAAATPATIATVPPTAVPLPEARPVAAPVVKQRRHRHRHSHHHRRHRAWR